ncbi:hypothetical protein Pla108_02380 [Botrimarina colliarenosi]|uniref:Uncharacterized protein n=1 Tax=Botrimarina colliarenosi TaxID=2528001 RepID=A0A5C6AMA3_9BACT|nr:hypothetical protein Pla108_02380 [Botrimarina colliarenosi]
MSAGFADSLESFHDFVGAKIASGKTMSPELALALWRECLREAAAIQEGLDALDRGDTRPVDDFLREIDAEFGLDAERPTWSLSPNPRRQTFAGRSPISLSDRQRAPRLGEKPSTAASNGCGRIPRPPVTLPSTHCLTKRFVKQSSKRSWVARTALSLWCVARRCMCCGCAARGKICWAPRALLNELSLPPATPRKLSPGRGGSA